MKSAVLPGRVLGAVVLARSLVRTLVNRLFGGTPGLALFHANYNADRLPAVTEDERAQMPALSRCVACGRCDVGEGARIAASRGRYPGLMTVVLASSRSMPDFDAAVVALDHVSDEVLRDKERVCPANVPFVALARFVRSKAAAASEEV